MKNTIIKNFMDEHKTFFEDSNITRGLYIFSNESHEMYIIERNSYRKNEVFVFEFDCGNFISCRTETDTMNKYLSDIIKSEYSEYVVFKE